MIPAGEGEQTQKPLLRNKTGDLCVCSAEITEH